MATEPAPYPSDPGSVTGGRPVPSGLAPPALAPVTLGRASPASNRPAALRRAAESSSAAYRADGGDATGWAVRAASVAGVRHRLAGRGPEDAYAWRILDSPADPRRDAVGRPAPGGEPAPGGVGPAPGGGEPVPGGAARPTVILAVADGVGSVEGSAAASAAAVDAVCAALATALPDGALPSLPGGAGDDDLWRWAFGAADAAVLAAGGATTLVVAVVGGDGRGAVARVGDSTALLLVGGGWGELWPAGAPDDGSLSTATAALPTRHGLAPEIDVVPVSLEAGDALILVTDGIADPLRDGPTTVAPALAEALAAVPSPLALALLADFSRQGCFDDRTVVGLWPQEDGGA